MFQNNQEFSFIILLFIDTIRTNVTSMFSLPIQPI